MYNLQLKSGDPPSGSGCQDQSIKDRRWPARSASHSTQTRFPSAQGFLPPLPITEDAIGSPNPSRRLLAPGKIPAHRRNDPPLHPMSPGPRPPSIGSACGSGIFHSLLTASDEPIAGRGGNVPTHPSWDCGRGGGMAVTALQGPSPPVRGGDGRMAWLMGRRGSRTPDALFRARTRGYFRTCHGSRRLRHHSTTSTPSGAEFAQRPPPLVIRATLPKGRLDVKTVLQRRPDKLRQPLRPTHYPPRRTRRDVS